MEAVAHASPEVQQGALEQFEETVVSVDPEGDAHPSVTSGAGESEGAHSHSSASSTDEQSHEFQEVQLTPRAGAKLTPHVSVFSLDAARKSSSSVPIVLTWENVKYTVVTKKRRKVVAEKVILRDITGSVRPGEMIAILGTSGAGKTSFLNVLAGRHVFGKIDGKILLNGVPRTKLYKRQSAYVEQDDLLFPNLTVRETFTYTALLRLSRKMTDAEKKARALDVITELGLTAAIDTRVGGEEKKGISGGERKRTSIGTELITNPRLLFLDEPTSGLDSFTAFHLLSSVRELAHAGRAVIATIHQPSRKIFDLFDKLLLLSKGRIVYYGPTDKAVDFFAQQGFPCPPMSNVADHFLDVCTVDTRTPELTAESSGRVTAIQDAYVASEYALRAKEEVEQRTKSALVRQQREAEQMPPSERKRRMCGLLPPRRKRDFSWNLPWPLEMGILLNRAWINYMREPRLTIIALVQTVCMALLVGGIFFQLGYTQQSIQNRSGALFFILINQSFGSMIAILTLFQSEKPVFMRERAAGTYRVSSYFMAKNIAELPVQIILPIIFGSIVYWMMGHQGMNAGRFFRFLVLLVATVVAAQSLGLVISAASPNIAVANAIGPIVMILFLLFGGFYLNSGDVWPGFIWIEKISFLYYGFRAVIVNEYSGETFTCELPTSCFRTGEAVIANYGFTGVNVWADFAVLIALTVGYRFLAYLALLFLAKPRMKLS